MVMAFQILASLVMTSQTKQIGILCLRPNMFIKQILRHLYKSQTQPKLAGFQPLKSMALGFKDSYLIGHDVPDSITGQHKEFVLFVNTLLN